MMKLKPKLLITLLSVCLLSFQAFGQTAAQKAKIIGKNSAVELQQLQQRLSSKYQLNHAKALKLAREKGWPIQKRLDNGSLLFLYGIDRFEQPIYVSSTNLDAAETTSTDEIQAGGTSGLELTGDSLTIGMWEVGTPLLTHQEYDGRMVQVESSGSPGLSDHASHVGGTLIAAGVVIDARGMATEGLVAAYTADNDEAEMAAAAAAGLLISNHSYGFITGWSYNVFGDGRWAWFGSVAISADEDYRFGAYTETTREWDLVGYNAPSYLVVKSGGNDRLSGPAPGTEHWYFNPTGGEDGTGAWELSTAARDLDGGPDGFDVIGEQGTAKNILTVGAVDDIDEGYSNRTDVVMSSFSSWGPTDDGRIKPDIVANGVNLYSSITTSPTAYASFSGTSMASPNAAGSLLLLQEHYNNLYGSFMMASTLKGLAIHSADEAGENPGPDYVFGHGLLNALNAATVISEKDVESYIKEEVLPDGETYSFEFEYDGSKPLVATLSWTDVPGMVSDSLPVLDDETIRLVNDLDVRITRNDMTYSPWILDPSNPAGAAFTGDNIRDNVEKIEIANAPAGTYTVTVTHKGALSGGSQAFSLIISGENVPSRPIIAVSPDFIQEALKVGQTSSQSLVIENQGNVSLHYNIGIRLAESDSSEADLFLADRSLLGEEGSSLKNEIARMIGQATSAKLGNNQPQDVDPSSVVLTHSVSQEVLAGNSIQCGRGTGVTRSHADNSYWRAYDLEEFGITGNFDVDSVQVGVQLATSGSEAGQPVIVRLYTTNGDFPGSGRTLIGSTLYMLPDQSLSIASIPVNATAFSGTTLIVEIFTPDGGSGPNNFFIGSNGAGETAPSYQSIPACGIPDPTPMVEIGFDDVHFVLNVVGNESASWLTVNPNMDTVAAGGSSNVAVNFDATDLEPGEYMAEIVIANSDFENPEVIVPVVLTVSGDSTGAPMITQFLIIDANSDEVVGTLEDGDLVDLAALPSSNLNIVAVTDSSSQVDAVWFELSSGNLSKSRLDKNAPYAAFGNRGGDFFGVTPLERSYSLTAVPYVDGAAAGPGKTVDFSVVNTGEEATVLVAYPNPVEDKVSLKFPAHYSGQVKISVTDQYGRKLEVINTRVTKNVREVSLDISRFNLRPNTEFYLKVESANNEPETIRIIKE